jgi:hypothetical protein
MLVDSTCKLHQARIEGVFCRFMPSNFDGILAR